MKKRELSKRIEEMKRLIVSNYYDLNYMINKKFNGYKREQDERYQMLLDYLKLEEKEYAELEEQGKFRTFKDVSNLIGGTGGLINIEAVKKTKLVKRK